MPELPEIETIRKSLVSLTPRHISDLYLSRLAPIETTTRQKIRQALRGTTWNSLKRHGKYLLFVTTKEVSLVLHLGMSGRLQFLPRPTPRPKHTHLEFFFDDGSRLRFTDARRFGTLSLANDQAASNAFLARLGPDYLDSTLRAAEYIARCRRHPRLSVKRTLLHQGIAAGLGNIYACEALYQAGIDPRRLINDLSDQELTGLLQAARDCLQVGIAQGGTTIRDYLDGLGHRGKMQKFLQVYDREGQTTRDGRGPVIRIVQQARSTWFCPEVQR